jgi:hypothetical protein
LHKTQGRAHHYDVMSARSKARVTRPPHVLVEVALDEGN